MKRIYFLSLVLLSVATSLMAQAPRVVPQGYLMPFPHGVASGDPKADRVIIWTRLSSTGSNPVIVNWKMATDTSLTNIVQSGTATSGPANDWTIKVDVTGLTANTWYYYQFEQGGRKSLVGRTRTLPNPGDTIAQVRFGVVSCSDVTNGFFNVYADLAQRNDVDAILHLGDYIYEYARSGSSLDGRDNIPVNEILSISDYRLRYSQYRLDGDLMRLHQYYPMIAVWDDHETANNAYRDGAENHTSGTEGTWSSRLSGARRVYSEWMPIREPDTNDTIRMWRDFEFGNLAHLIMLDTRVYDRDQQLTGSTTIPGIPFPLLSKTDATLNSPTRKLIGPVQLAWVANKLRTSTQKWHVFGQQVMMGPLNANITGIGSFIVNTDQWDGYPAERKRVIDTIVKYNIPNNVVLTGDIHTSWANDVPNPDSTYNNGAGSALVEFVGTSVTSGSGGIGGISVAQIQQFGNPQVKYANLTDRGYLIVDITPKRARCDYNFVSTIATRTFTRVVSNFWKCDSGARKLSIDSVVSAQVAPKVTVPPAYPNQPLVPTSIAPEAVTLLANHPNPFNEGFLMQYYNYQAGPVELRIIDLTGREMRHVVYNHVTAGLQQQWVESGELAPGTYIMKLTAGSTTYSRSIVHVK